MPQYIQGDASDDLAGETVLSNNSLALAPPIRVTLSDLRNSSSLSPQEYVEVPLCTRFDTVGEGCIRLLVVYREVRGFRLGRKLV